MENTIDVKIVAEDMYNVWTVNMGGENTNHCKYEELPDQTKEYWIAMAKSAINSIYSQSFDIVRR